MVLWPQLLVLSPSVIVIEAQAQKWLLEDMQKMLESILWIRILAFHSWLKYVKENFLKNTKIKSAHCRIKDNYMKRIS